MTTRLVVLADTHMSRGSRTLPSSVIEEIEHSHAIVHLGDFTDESVLGALQELRPVYAVHGNNDSDYLTEMLPPMRILRVEGHEIVLIHGHIGGRTALAAARAVGRGSAVLFGHSHRPMIEYLDGRLLFNPGSPTERRGRGGRAFGLLEIDSDAIRPQIIPLEGIDRLRVS